MSARSTIHVPRSAHVDRGQAVLLMLPIMAAALLLALGAAIAGRAVLQRARAQTAADAAALAAVTGGAAAAGQLARANGAALVSVARVGDDVIVTVSFDGVTASARATDGP